MNKNNPSALCRLPSAFLDLLSAFLFTLITRKQTEDLSAIQVIYNVYEEGTLVGKEAAIVNTTDRGKAVEAFENSTKDRHCLPEDFVAIVSKIPGKATVIEPIS
jgi:hypothetical protein